jgi:hypothetical protein
MTTTDMENILDFDKEVTGENNSEIIRGKTIHIIGEVN